MTDTINVSMREFDLLSQAAQQRLRARIADQGSIEHMEREIRGQLAECDRESATSESARRTHQANRAFFVAQLTYLQALSTLESTQSRPEKHNFKTRLRSAFGRAQMGK